MRVPASPIRPADTIRSVVDIAAPPDEVFRALTDPRELAAWLGDGAAAPVEVEPRWAAPTVPTTGQSWRAPALGPGGMPGWVRGEYLLVQPPHRLETTWRASWDEQTPDRVVFELVPIDVGGRIGTSLTVTHTRAAAHLQVTASARPARVEGSPALALRVTKPLALPHPASSGKLGEKGVRSLIRGFVQTNSSR